MRWQHVRNIHIFLNTSFFYFLWIKTSLIYWSQVIRSFCLQSFRIPFIIYFLQFFFDFSIRLRRNKYFNVGWLVWFNKFDFIHIHNVSWYFHKFWSTLQRVKYSFNALIRQQNFSWKQTNTNKFLIFKVFYCSQHIFLINYKTSRSTIVGL